MQRLRLIRGARSDAFIAIGIELVGGFAIRPLFKVDCGVWDLAKLVAIPCLPSINVSRRSLRMTFWAGTVRVWVRSRHEVPHFIMGLR
jgi:hypothetical protein